MMKKKLSSLLALAICCISASATPSGNPDLVFNTTAYQEVGEDNRTSLLIGTTEASTFTVVDAYGERTVDFDVVTIDESGEYVGNWITTSAPTNGQIKIWGDLSKVEMLIYEGGNVTSIDGIQNCTNMWILNLQHNALQKLDLTPLKELGAIYLTDNPFTKSTPLKIGTPKNNLQILEIDIVDWLDQSFNLSAYPNMMMFDGYHNLTLKNVDPTGCPRLMSLSVELCPVETLDVSQNPDLYHLNIAETKITDIDLSNNPKLYRFLAGHDSGSINVGYKLNSIDLTHNPELVLVHLSGNQLGSVDLSANTKLVNLNLKRNALTSIDLSNNPAIYSLNLMFNDLDYATLPLPGGNIGEYWYTQNNLSVPKSVQPGQVIDLSNRVLREGTTTSATVWRQVYSGDDEILDPDLYSYADGKITFNQAIPDSVYVQYSNSVFDEYKLQTSHFRVKSPEEYGKPSAIISMTAAGENVGFHVGLAGATSESPRMYYVDFGDGVRKEFYSSSALDYTSSGTFASGKALGLVTIYLPEGEVMTSFNASDTKLAAIDITKATELSRLNLTNCGLADINLQYNRCLQELYLADNNLLALDLQGIYGDYEKNVLATLDASGNDIASVNVIATYAMQHMKLAYNKLADIDLDNYDNLISLDLSGNLLTEVNLKHLLAATSVNLSNNLLTTVYPCDTYLVKGVNLTGNYLTYSTLPLPDEFGTGYVYAPQRWFVIPEQAAIVNLGAASATVDGKATTYVWKKTDGTALVEGTDYEISGDVTKFLDTTLGEVYCELSNAAFPQMKGDKVLRTSNVEVVETPRSVVARFTTLSKNGTEPMLILAAHQPMQLYIDWTGSDENLYPYPVETEYKQFPISKITNNAVVTIYADSPEDAANVKVFSIYQVKLADVDLSALTGAVSINLGSTMLTEDQVKMPDAPDMYDMNLESNRFTRFPYADKFPNLAMLNMSNNNLTEFDSSDLKSMGYLVLSRNKLTHLEFDNPRLWSIFADQNSLESIDLSNLPWLEQILLMNNKLKSIDLSPVENTLNAISLIGNEFTFATLPLQSDYPKLNVFYYGNQAKMPVTCEDMRVDLSSQWVINYVPTTFRWFVGMPTMDEESYEYVGTELVEGTDFEILDGVTHFLTEPDGKVCCLMNNENFPNLDLFTELVSINRSGISALEGEDGVVRVYNLQGVLVREAAGNEALNGLAPGVYIANGKKITVK